MKVNGNDPAYPVLILGEDMRLEAQHTGMPIRLAIAMHLMPSAAEETGSGYDKAFSNIALRRADALIAAYNDSEGN